MCKHMVTRSGVNFVTLTRLVIASTLIAIPNIGAALDLSTITDAETALLPRYCAYSKSFPGNSAPEAKLWEARLGQESFKHIHHYCWGLIELQRARRSSTSREQAQYLLGASTSDFEYSIRRVAKNFVLLPEMLTRNGEVYLLRSRPNDASKSFAQARALKPDYWPAYSSWAEFLMQSGKRAEAKRIVNAGLKYSPNAKVLREQYRLLGGRSTEAAAPLAEHPPADDVSTANSAK
ncbi:hypothetical protein [Candidatus Accumulibacter sp. ACC003]|uniref:hypothetical protein n=1 Tax=Candidatus Accumulibacter sp. ACC003 TaxID=2823334 RepID=UPI0025C33251|nr:hypothetical protein [Candidatus Accumulibacter sp. ACC003]